MPHSAGEVPGRFYATDLRLIRKQQQLTLNDVSRITKIPIEIVDLFEQTGLLDHPRFNEVYLRSFVRQYAQAINVSQNVAMAALEASIEDRYDGSLAAHYLPAPPEPEAPAPPSAAPSASGEPATPPSESAVPDPDPRPESVVEPPPEPGHAYTIESLKKEAADVPRSPRTPVERPAPTPRELPILPILIGFLVVLLVAFAFFAWPLLAPADTEVFETEEAAPEVRPAEPAPGPATQSYRVVLTADGGPLSGIRLLVDQDESRRYWIEAADSLVFDVSERFVLTAGSSMDRVRVEVDGVELPTDRVNTEGSMEYDVEAIRTIVEANSG